MQFQEANVPLFLEVFHQSCSQIRNFPGCTHLRLLQHATEASTFFTYSHWAAPEDLENYRHSDLFKGVWAKTKVLFAAPAAAWSTIEKHIEP
jgi:heme-degrading monooxygenase HmoA